MNSDTTADSSGLAPVTPLYALTGLRFFAALAVLFVHSEILATGLEKKWSCLATHSVAFFFVLSGFILSHVYAGRLRFGTIPAFYAARIARIWPLHLVCLLIALGVMIPQQRFAFSFDHWFRFGTHALLLQSWIPRAGWSDWFNGPAWSISTELGFYLLFPFFLLLGKRSFWIAWALLVAGTAGAIYGFEVWCAGSLEREAMGHHLLYVNPLFRLAEFVSGMAIARLYQAGWRGSSTVAHPFRDTFCELLAIGSFVGLVWLWANGQPLHRWVLQQNLDQVATWGQRSGGVLPACILLVWVFSWSTGMVARFLSRPLMVWLGEISFALYLIQQPVHHFMKPLVEGRDLPVVLVTGTAIGVSLSLAALLYTAVEMPMRQTLVAWFRGRWEDGGEALRAIPKQLWDSGVGVGAVLLLVALILGFRSEARRSDLMQRRVAAAWGSLAVGRGFQRITFQDEAILHGVDWKKEANGIRITLLWQVLPGNSRARFVHFSGDDGQILKQGSDERKLFAEASPGSMVLDEIWLKPGSYPVGSVLGIGFYSKEAGTTRIDRGVLGMGKKRLELIRLNAAGPEWIREPAD